MGRLHESLSGQVTSPKLRRVLNIEEDRATGRFHTLHTIQSNTLFSIPPVPHSSNLKDRARVQVIAATNCINILDLAPLRHSGRLDCKIKFPLQGDLL
jgi:SpoVK/Ycf46/Vps4 family AAA+-type ATPase